MTQLEPIGLRGLDSVHFYVRDHARMRRVLVDLLDFAEVGENEFPGSVPAGKLLKALPHLSLSASNENRHFCFNY